MASLTQGSPLPDVNTTTAQTTTAPQYYTDYLSNLATAGNTATAMDPTKMVAGFDQMQTKGFEGVQPAAEAYKPGLSAAEQTANTAAGGLTSSNINALMNPYTSNVVDEMARLQQQNVQRNVLPGLKAAFAGTGGSGSQRFANVTGQTLADLQSNLTGQQQGALSQGYSQALQAALQNLQLQNQAATTQGNLAAQEQNLGLTGAQAMLNAGAQKQALEQAKIDAPLKQASNAAALLRGYNVPTSTTQTYKGPMPGAYSASPLQQIAGLATLFASGAGGTSAASGVSKVLSDLYNKLKSDPSYSMVSNSSNTVDANGNPVNPNGGDTVINDPLGGGTDADYSGMNEGPELSDIDMGGGGETTFYGDGT
jgi:hypothetical protein